MPIAKTRGVNPIQTHDLLDYEYFGNFEVLEVFSLDTLAVNDWREPIVDYLKNLGGST